MTVSQEIRSALGAARVMRPATTGHARFLVSQFSYSQRNADRGYTDEDHLRAAANWLEAAQDATPDGGFTGRYSLDTGWTSSYPETTGYIIPTLLALSEHFGEQRYFDRAEAALQFLLDLQLDSGAFPGREVGENLVDPSPFNTGQIVHGLVAWHAATGCERTLQSACRAADWLLTVQDDDGAFRRHFYHDKPATYSTHLTCWLAQLGQHIDEPRYLDAASRHMDWVMEQRVPETGWFELCGFDDDQQGQRIAYTHTIAYTVWGVLYCGRVLGREDLVAAAEQASAAIARRLELSGTLPGLLNWRFRRAGHFTCLTGNAQMALIWMNLFEATQDAWWLNAAFKAIDEIKSAQCLENPNPGIQGGVAGSFPIWGEYLYGGVLNWATKYFVDALVTKHEVLSRLADRERPDGDSVANLPESLPTVQAARADVEREATTPSIVVLTQPHSTRLAHFAAAWEKRGVTLTAVVFEVVPDPSIPERLWSAVNERGVASLVWKFLGRTKQQVDHTPATPDDEVETTSAAFCEERGLRTLSVGRLTDPDSQAAIRALNPDLLIQAGVGILRKGLLEIPTLGTVNVHMSILPSYRGMNVAEWAAFNGHDNGCTVHLIDEGIDTGEILLIRKVSRDGCASVAELRHKIDQAQRELVAEVVEYVATTGTLPAGREQTPSEGRQYFRLHPDLGLLLDRELSKPG